MPNNPTSLIINSPYVLPEAHWQFKTEADQPVYTPGRRVAGYMISDPTASKPYLDNGVFVDLPLVNQMRKRVDEWRAKNYPGITSVTKDLLQHWNDREQREYPFFFCQIEAIETLIWLVETDSSQKVGLDIPKDGGEFNRLCSKLATGTGKTVVMAMLIAWQVLNRVANSSDNRFSKNIFIVAPNLTVRERLAVLNPTHAKNYYDEFRVVPPSYKERLQQGRVLIRNWHALNWETEERKKGVDKRGAKSDKAYVRDVLGDMAGAKNLVVINDEAHHAWRVPEKTKAVDDVKQEDIDEATKWIGGLDRIHQTLGILNCFDFSATPFIPRGRGTSREESLFGWIVSDFGLNDAIESGLVKTPRIVVREDAPPDTKTYKPRLYHLYNDPEVKDDFNRRAEPNEPLPDLVTNAYYLLGLDWRAANENWKKYPTPPVMITVCNRTETAARIKYAFDNGNILIKELCEPQGILHIDSQVLKQAEEKEPEPQKEKILADGVEASDPKLTKKQQAELLREQVNTVGQEGKPGASIKNVISVGMLSEGWDARTVTHIMGLRAFTSQLLCEQVIGRGLRRSSYEINEDTGLFDAEYVNVFGVPFSFLPHEGAGGNVRPEPETTLIQPVEEKIQHEIKWPNVIRIERTSKPHLEVDWEQVDTLEIDTAKIVKIAEIAPTVDGKSDFSQISDIDLDKLAKEFRRQTLIFKAAKEVWEEMKQKDEQWQADSGLLMAELVRLAEEFIVKSNAIQIVPGLFNQDPRRRQLVLALSMTKIIRHFSQTIGFKNTESTELVLETYRPIVSTADMRPWRTRKPCQPAKKSHINYCVLDSTWESADAAALDRSKHVKAWVKNDHLGFEVLYVYRGVVRKYRPDFLVKLANGNMLVVETKGQKTEKDETKMEYLKDWTQAVTENGSYGNWDCLMVEHPGVLAGELEAIVKADSAQTATAKAG